MLHRWYIASWLLLRTLSASSGSPWTCDYCSLQKQRAVYFRPLQPQSHLLQHIIALRCWVSKSSYYPSVPLIYKFSSTQIAYLIDAKQYADCISDWCKTLKQAPTQVSSSLIAIAAEVGFPHLDMKAGNVFSWHRLDSQLLSAFPSPSPSSSAAWTKNISLNLPWADRPFIARAKRGAIQTGLQ